MSRILRNWLKEHLKRVPGAVSAAHNLRASLSPWLSETWLSLFINTPEDHYAWQIPHSTPGRSSDLSIIVNTDQIQNWQLLIEEEAISANHRQEYILVKNDPDNSIEEIVRFTTDKTNAKAIAHAGSSNSSGVRNTGLLNASGESICFVDAICPSIQTAIDQKFDRRCLLKAGGFIERPDAHQGQSALIREPDELAELRKVQVFFLPHKDYHVWAVRSITEYLQAYGIKSLCVDVTCGYGDEGARAAIAELELDSITINEYLLIDPRPGVVVCFNDWEDRVVGPVVEHCNERDIPTIGIVEGVQDFEDADTGRQRKPYGSVQHVFLAGRYDRKFFSNRAQSLYEVGVPRIEKLFAEPFSMPQSPLIVVNLNFSYGVLTDIGRQWLDSAVAACQQAELPYVISQHPADTTDLTGYAASDMDMYTLLRRGSAFVSRFSSGILESIALGKPVIYHNPHGETVNKFQNSLGAYQITSSTESLVEALRSLPLFDPDIRDRARPFLDLHCNLDSGQPAAELAAGHIHAILKADQ